MLWCLRCAVICLGLLDISASADSDPLVEQRDAAAWLKKIQLAAQKQNYSGIFVYQQANRMHASRITHVVDGKNELEKLEILDGRPREYIRNNDEVVCYLPEIRTLQVEKRSTPDFFPAMLAVNSSDLVEHYDIKKGDGGRIAGYDCQAITLTPKDNLRYGYRLWAEKSSGLLMRAQTINERNEVVEQITFAQVNIGNIDKERVKPTFPNTVGWRIENAPVTEGLASGWSVAAIPAGFKKVHELKRTVTEAPQTKAGTSPSQHDVTQIVYSDGLAAISVFVEPGTRSRTEVSMQQGAMNIVGKRQGDFWLTIVGEVPDAAIKQVANSIEFKPK
jgi:sigma-E factor negative regulatory protein RseB